MSLAAIQAQENRTLARRIMPKAAGVKPGPQPSRKAAKRVRTKCMKKARPKSRRGKASCMPGQLWPMWLAHVHKKGTCWLHACLVLTHVLCLRVTEALRLRASDFNWKNRIVWIAPLKGQCAVRKPLLSALLPVLRHLRAHGLACRRTRPRGVLGKALLQMSGSGQREMPCFFLQSAEIARQHIATRTQCARSSSACARHSLHQPGCGWTLVRSGPTAAVKEWYKISSWPLSQRKLPCCTRALPTQGWASVCCGALGSRCHCPGRTFRGYGQVSEDQAGQILEENEDLKHALRISYKNRR